MSVHDVEMEEIDAGPLDVGHLARQGGEVGGKQRWGDAYAHWATQIVMMSLRDNGAPAGGY